MGEKPRILVVDDELPVCKSICSALAPDAYEVDMALSAEEALKKEEESEYDVVITDLMMPGLSGLDLLKALKERRQDVRVIMVTGYPSIESAVQSIKFGAFDYIPKPFTPNDLRSLAARALESRRYQKEQEAKAAAGRAEKPVTPPTGLYFIPENSWAVTDEDGNVRVGIHHAFLRAAGDVVSVELPKEGEIRYQGEACVRMSDAVGHVHKVWTPVTGKILVLNEAVARDSSVLFDDPYGKGWVLVLRPSNLESDLKNLTQ
ncbi:MAG: response regulator [Candidatus Eisenbacteria bacterium]|nr:response regulator [Candidatus Eisenbacteria bacterium]